ncbi:MAG: hypothetical protein VX778_03165, partial [Candidatus Thermoplasmatota archaeon]|nr:hypothetical protein [Candidatus Thermoplasmatota archaeon]
RDTDGDGVIDANDDCDDTLSGTPVDEFGCEDDSAYDVDLDGDGYFGEYTYDIDSETGLRINQAGDRWPLDNTQWFDTDGDGYGDNYPDQLYNSPSNPRTVGIFVQGANNSDFCPLEFGTSSLDTFEIGCEDDGDGWADNFGRDKFPGNPTQWFDSDADGYGDNWGDKEWNESRESSWPGEFISGATQSDKCPDTKSGAEVNEFGCSSKQWDTDGDGVVDFDDNCKETPKGPDGYDDGCPLPKSETDDESTMILGMTLPVFGGVLAGGIVVLLLLIMLLGRIRNRGYDYDDDDDDDDDFFDDDDDDFFSSFQSKPMPARSTPAARDPPSSGPSRGPSGGPPPSRGPSGPKRGPPGASSGPSRGPPGRGPPGGAKPAATPATKKAPVSRKIEDEPEE